MHDPALIWLIIPAFLAATGLLASIYLGLSWSWGFALQWSLILLVSLYGIFFQKSEIIALLAWVLFGIFAILPRLILKRLAEALFSFRNEDAYLRLRQLCFFYWGKPAKLWRDITKAMIFFGQGDTEGKGEACLVEWDKEKLPKAARETLQTYLASGFVIARKWSRVVALYEAKPPTSPMQWSRAFAVCRAYLELGQVSQATQVLKQNSSSSNYLAADILYLAFIPFFSLTGSEENLTSLFARLNEKTMPDVARKYWLGRCFAVKGMNDQAKAFFERALGDSSQSGWQERIHAQLAKLASGPCLDFPDYGRQVTEIKNVLNKALATSDIFSERRAPKVVQVLIALNVIVYLLSHSYLFSHSPHTILYCITFVQSWLLQYQYVHQGEYYRLITYQFLHSGLTHLSLNLLGLYWFGRLVQKFYGSWKLLIIYFGSGILSGCCQLAFAGNMGACGASGAVLGLFAASAAAIVRQSDLLPSRLRVRELSWMGALAVLQMIFDHFVPGIAGYIHIGGLISGFALGLVLPLSRVNFEAEQLS